MNEKVIVHEMGMVEKIKMKVKELNLVEYSTKKK